MSITPTWLTSQPQLLLPPTSSSNHGQDMGPLLCLPPPLGSARSSALRAQDTTSAVSSCERGCAYLHSRRPASAWHGQSTPCMLHGYSRVGHRAGKRVPSSSSLLRSWDLSRLPFQWRFHVPHCGPSAGAVSHGF